MPQTAAPDLPETDADFRRDLIAGLSAPFRRIPSKHLYDHRGAVLFERICELPEYYPTRTEIGIMQTRLDEIAAAVGVGARVVEYGSGASTKTRMLLDSLEDPAVYHPVDISRRQLEETAAALDAEFPDLEVRPCHGDFNTSLDLDSETPQDGRTVAYFPGSTMGNLPLDDADGLLRRTRDLVGRDGGFLLGLDLVKDVETMERAYDDAAGVTAEFNLNLLDRMREELGAEVQRRSFRFQSGWNPARGSIESRLVATRPTEIVIDEHRFAFDEGDFIHTEDSRKFDLEHFLPHAERCGFGASTVWTDPKGWFAILLLESAA